MGDANRFARGCDCHERRETNILHRMAPLPDDTLSLIRRAQGADIAARELLFERHLPRLQRALALHMGRRAREIGELDDVCQETLCEASQHLDSIRELSPGCFMNWLVKIAHNKLADRARRECADKRGGGRVRVFAAYSSRVLADSVLGGSDPSPSQCAGAHELEERIEAAVLGLGEREREIFRMRAVCGMSFEEIAIDLGLERASSARTAYSRVLARVSAVLPPEWLAGRASADQPPL